MTLPQTLNPLVRQLLACGLLALSLPGQAQTAPAAEPAATEEAAKPKADTKSLESVTVTASRRSERLQDVPLAVSAVSGTQLENAGVRSLSDIATAVSGVTFGLSPQDAGFRVRGVGTLGGFSSASEQPVGVVVDGVVMGLGPVVDSLNDVERVEVLKGPQGTQFGKNASSGVVSIITRRPSTKRLEGELSLSYGSLNEHDVNAQLNVPINDIAALGVSLFDKGYDGYLHNLSRNEDWGGIHQWGARAKLLLKPAGNLDVLLSADFSKSRMKGQQQLWSLRSAPAALAAEFSAAGITPGNDNTATSEGAEGFEHINASGVSAELNYRFGDYTFTSISAHRARDTQLRYGLDTRAATVMEGGGDKTYAQDSQEFRITSPKGALEYVAGLYWSRLKSDTGESAWLQPSQLGAPVPAGVFVSLTNGINYTSTDSRSTALFGDGKLQLTPALRLLAGARYTQDRVSAANWTDASQVTAQLGQPAGFLVPSTDRVRQEGQVSANKASGRLGLEWKPGQDLMLFATVARGYLGPTVAFSGLTGTRSNVLPQTVNDLTIGAKSQFLDRTLTLNVSLFQDTYTNLQVGRFDAATSEFLTENAGGMRSKGFEIDGQAVLGGGFRARASLTYADAKFTSYETVCPTTGDTARCYLAADGKTSLFQGAGEAVPGAPKLTASLGLDHGLSFDNGFQLDSTVNFAWRGATSYGVGETLYRQDGYGVLNLAFKLTPESDRWHLGLWARNLLDKHYQSAVIGLPFAPPGGVVNWNTRDARRTLGVTVGAKF